jgi:hypothetical protein
LAVFRRLLLLTARHRINRESFEEIQLGISLEQVEAILGMPQGYYSNRVLLPDGTGLNEFGLDWNAWIGDEGGKNASCYPKSALENSPAEQFAHRLRESQAGSLDS